MFETGLAYGMTADFSTTQNGDICLAGKSVCFTGKFLSGSRKMQETTAIKLGAIIKNSVSKNIDFLVLGAVASRDWRYSSYGRKVERILGYRNNGFCIDIINEELWNILIISK